MPETPETESYGELFTNLEGIERGNALLAKLQELLPEESMPDNAWEYDEYGEVTSTDYLRDLTQEIAMQGGYVETIHKQLNKLVEAEQKICRFPERLAEVDIYEINNIKTDIEKFSAAEIDRVANIQDVAEAKLDINRQLMNTAILHYGTILDPLRKTSKVFLDVEKTKYPDFWKLYNQVNTMRTSLGIMGRNSITRIPRS